MNGNVALNARAIDRQAFAPPGKTAPATMDALLPLIVDKNTGRLLVDAMMREERQIAGTGIVGGPGAGTTYAAGRVIGPLQIASGWTKPLSGNSCVIEGIYVSDRAKQNADLDIVFLQQPFESTVIADNTPPTLGSTGDSWFYTSVISVKASDYKDLASLSHACLLSPFSIPLYVDTSVTPTAFKLFWFVVNRKAGAVWANGTNDLQIRFLTRHD